MFTLYTHTYIYIHYIKILHCVWVSTHTHQNNVQSQKNESATKWIKLEIIMASKLDGERQILHVIFHILMFKTELRTVNIKYREGGQRESNHIHDTKMQAEGIGSSAR